MESKTGRDKMPHDPSANIEGQDLWPIMQPVTRGRSTYLGFTLREVSCCPFIYAVNSPDSITFVSCVWTHIQTIACIQTVTTAVLWQVQVETVEPHCASSGLGSHFIVTLLSLCNYNIWRTELSAADLWLLWQTRSVQRSEQVSKGTSKNQNWNM